MRSLSQSLLPVLATFGLLAASPELSTRPAQAAVIYCKGGPGVPKGCVVRPTAPIVYCTAPGVPVGCAVRPAAPAARAATRTPTNRNGGINRAGPRR